MFFDRGRKDTQVGPIEEIGPGDVARKESSVEEGTTPRRSFPVQRLRSGEGIERGQDDHLPRPRLDMDSPARPFEVPGFPLDPDPTSTFSLRVVRGRRESEPRVEMTRNQTRGAQNQVRRPAMTVEDPDVSSSDSGRRVDDDLAREMTNDADVVVAENELDLEALAQELGEEVEQHGPQEGRSADEGMLGIARDHDRVGTGRTRDRYEGPGEPIGRPLGRSQRTLRGAAEAEMQVGDDERPRSGRCHRFEDERRGVGYGPKWALHQGLTGGCGHDRSEPIRHHVLRQVGPYSLI